MGQVLVIHMTPREIKCGMCGVTDNQDHLDDRKAVPIWNGEPTTSDGECDGYKAVCAKCYGRWDAWDERMKRSNDRVEGRDAALSRRVPSHDGLCGVPSEPIFLERTER